MSYTYDKTITADINGPVLKAEIDAAVSNVLGWGISGSTYSFVKTTAWSSSDQTTLDSVVAAHNGELADEPVQEDPDNRTKLGYGALAKATTASACVAIGEFALENCLTGDENVAVGCRALQDTTGENNTAMGTDVLISLVTGDGNIAIGRDAGKEYDGGESNNILIGNDGVHEDDAVIRIGNSQTSAFLKGVHGVTPTGATETVIIDANGEMGSTASSGGSAHIVMHSFGGRMDSTYKYAVINGNSDDSDQSDTPKTRCPVAAGTIIKMVFKSEDASTSTKLQFKKNGSNIGNNFSLPGSSGTVLPASFGTITFNDGDYIQLMRTHDPDPNRSIWNVFVELT